MMRGWRYVDSDGRSVPLRGPTGSSSRGSGRYDMASPRHSLRAYVGVPMNGACCEVTSAMWVAVESC